MLRKFRIRTRLLISFFIMVLFTLIVGLTAFGSLNRVRNMAVKTINNVRILNDIYEYCASVDAGIYSMLHVADPTLTRYVVQTIKDNKEKALNEMDKYLEIQEEFSEVFSPGEMQDMINIVEVYKNNYIALANEVVNLVEHDKKEEALSISINRLTPLYNSILHGINTAFNKNLEYSEILTAKSNESVSFSTYIMLALVLLSLVVSILLAAGVTKSISIPLSELEESARKVANGELDVQIEQQQSNDEIAYLSSRLQQMLRYLHQTQHIKLEAINAQYEKEKAEESARSKGEFLAKMSHEIRTPMNAITGMAELALREEMPPAAREHIFTIKQASSNLLSIINDILDFSKIESGKLEIVPMEYQFSSLVNDVVNIIRMRVIDSPLRFIVFIDSNIPGTLFGDEIRIRQILLNLLSNAVKYTEEGFVSLSISAQVKENTAGLVIDVADSGRGIRQNDIKKLFGNFVQIDLESNKGIEGTGLGLAITHGIVKAMNGEILVDSEYGKGSTFTVKLPQEIRRNEKLAAVNKPDEKRVLVYELDKIFADSIVRTMNNLGVECRLVTTDIRLYEEIASGKYSFIFIAYNQYEQVKTLFTKNKSNAKIVLLTQSSETALPDQDYYSLAMPLHSISAANILNGTTASAAFGTGTETLIKFTAPSVKILVVDDIYTNLKVAEGLLQPYKMQVDLCKSGEEAFSAIKKQEYDIIFMDHMMPEMDGIEATKRIRSWEKQQNDANILQVQRKPVPIIALTANAVMGMRDMFLDTGFSDFLAKPIDVVKLDELLNKWIPREKREQRAEKKVPGAGKEALEKKPSLSFDIQGVDTEKGMAMTGGTEESYRIVLTMFYRDAQERLPLLQKAPSAQTMDKFITQVHALKSAAASIGAMDLSHKAARLEAAGKAEDIDGIQKNLGGFAKQLDELVKNIQAALKTDTAAGAPVESGTADEDESAEAQDALTPLLPLLKKLKNALELQNFPEIDRLLNKAGKRPLDAEIKEALEKISDDVLVTEFDSAIKSIEKILNDK
jgi:signal transduction histidine kinase/CheY-like chemotaxis protein